jgi:hypothetical protein
MKLHIHRFVHNTPISYSDIIKTVSYREHPDGIIVVRFTVKDKYYYIDGEWSANTKDYKGQGLSFTPLIWDGENYLDPDDCDLDSYYDHPDWWKLDLVLECDKYYTAKVIPLKHEYLWVLIPHDIVFGSYEKMSELEVVE